MTHFNDELRQLQQQVARYTQLSAQIPELQDQRDTLQKNITQLEETKLKEQKDVDRLEGHSLAAFFYNVIGKMDEKLDEERREAYAARVKYDTAAFELAAVEKELAACQAEWSSLQDCRERYDDALQKKAAQIREAGGAYGEQILTFEEKLAVMKSQNREIEEAVAAGETALEITKQVMEALDSAEGYASWDVMGGGIIADSLKHSAMDEAQAAVNRLQRQLLKFRTELADVEVRAHIQISMDGFSRFADYFFDNLFTDWSVMDEICNAQNQIRETRKQIKTVIANLQQRQKALVDEENTLKQQLGDMILQI